jgi:hypothetical protein
LRFNGENKCKRGKNQGKRHAGGVILAYSGKEKYQFRGRAEKWF